MGMKTVLNSINKVFDRMKTPLEPLPPPLLLIGSQKRSGLSAEEIASDIIARQAEAGAPFGNMFDGSNNVSEAMELIRIQVILEHLLTNAKIEIVIPPGLPVTSFGANAGGAIVTQGTTTMMGVGTGVIR